MDTTLQIFIWYFDMQEVLVPGSSINQFKGPGTHINGTRKMTIKTNDEQCIIYTQWDQ